MSFSGFVITDKGAALLAKAQTGTKITFTKAQIGSGYLPEETVITQTTALYGNNPVVVPISGLSTANKQSTISVQISNAAFSSEFVFREIGIFANDPTEGEILYLYGNAGESAETIPSKSVPQEFLFNLITKIGNATNITIEVDNGIVYASKADVAALEGQLKDAVVVEQISDSSFIPVVDSTDEGKTKKISWSKIKELLGGIMTFATQNQAEEGVDNETVMTPLRVFQAIYKWLTTQTISTLTTTSKTLPGATNELKASKADSLYYNNGQLQLRSGQNNVGLPVSIATGDTIHAFVCGHDNFSVTLESASNTFTIPEAMGYDTTKVVHLFHNDVPLIRGKHYSISSVGVVTLDFAAEAGDVFDGEIEHTSFEAEDLHGIVPVASGGTGATTAEEARKNLGVPKIKAGTYTGDGKDSKFIDVGFTPLGVLVSRGGTSFGATGSYCHSGFAVNGFPAMHNDNKVVEVTTGGFTVYGSNSNLTNVNTVIFHYVAWG